MTVVACVNWPSSRPDSLDGYGHFRSLRSVTAWQRRQALPVTQLVRDLADALSRHVRLPDPALPSLPAHAGDLTAAEERAAQLWRAWGVPPGPVADVTRLTERHGVVTARHRVPAPGHIGLQRPVSGTSGQHGQPGQAKRDRDRFGVSHEIGHLVMHEADGALASKAAEAQANRFALAFLLPADDIAGQLPSRPDWVRLLTLKQQWHVSLGALLRRASDLGVMSDQAYTQAMRTVSTRGWRTSEPGDLGAPESPRFLALAIAGASTDTAGEGLHHRWRPAQAQYGQTRGVRAHLTPRGR